MLEEELGVRLLDRSPRGVQPTPAGEALYRSAVSVLRQVTQIPAKVKMLGDVGGRVSVGIPTSTAEVLAIPLMKAVAQRFPSITLDIDSNSSGHLLEWLVNSKLDLALLFLTDPLRPIAALPLITEDLCLVSAAGFHDLEAHSVHADSISLKEVGRVSLVLPSASNGLRHVVDLAFESVGITPNVITELGTLQALKLAVYGGVAATILPISALSSELEQNPLQIRRIVDPVIKRQVTLCHNTDVPLSMAARTVQMEIVRLVKAIHASGDWPGHVTLAHPVPSVPDPEGPS